MSIVYEVNYTDPLVTSFTVNPNQIDGPGGTTRNTSLVLHGTGRLKYGEAVNENFLHLLENFASPANPMPLLAPIQSATNSGSVGTHTIVVLEDRVNAFIPDFQFNIINSISNINDGSYTVLSASYNQPTNKTTIIINEALPDASLINLGEVQYTLIEPNPALVQLPWTIGQVWHNKNDNVTYIYRNINVGLPILLRWEPIAGAIACQSTAPINPADCDLWYDDIQNQLKIFTNGTWTSVADRYVLKAGDVMNGNGIGSVGNTTGVLKFENGTSDFLFLGEGQGNITLGGDIRAEGDMLQSADTDIWINFDGNNNMSGAIIFAKGAHTSSATPVFRIENDGTLHTDILNYEVLVTDINDIPNKKYIDDAITGLSTSLNFVRANPVTPGPVVGDIRVTGTGTTAVIEIWTTQWVQIFPPLYAP